LESQTLRFMQDMAREDNYSIGCWPSTISPYLTLTGTWDDYFEGLHRKYRSNIRNRLSRLCKMGAVEFEAFSTEDEIAHSLQAGLEIEAKAWKGQAGTAILCHSDLLAFYQNFAQRAAEQGWMKLYFLTLNGRKIAFSYSLLYHKTLYMLKPGYDPALAPLSPSNLLCSMMIKDAFKLGLREFDFLGTNDEWKLNWTGVTRPHCWLFIFSKTLPGPLLHYLKFHVSPELKKFRLFRMLSNARERMFNADHS
jgi:CelD/BcsL family acetyltransferase involved in cellulose biosynthesis